ncbi:MAG: PAS domain-containing protein [Phycisphaerae bacterium]|nr:PAS domain-containing protein [Phycisphaerae bacterium]
MTTATVQKMGLWAVILLCTAVVMTVGITLWLWEPLELPFNALAVIFFIVGVSLGIWGYRRYLAKSIDSVVTQLRHIAGNDDFGQLLQDHSGELTDLIRPLNQCLWDINRNHEEALQDKHTLTGRSKILEMQYTQSMEILDRVSDGVLVTNGYGELTMANSAAEALLGFRREESYRKRIDDIIADGGLCKLINDARTRGSKTPKNVVEHSFDSFNRPRTLKVTLSELGGNPETLTGVVVVLRDISGQREADRNKIDFVTSISHELKTPLSSIQAYIKMLLDGEIKGKGSVQEFYETINAETQRLYQMIEQILNVSRVESGGVTILREPVSMTAVIKQVAGNVTPKILSKNLTLQQELAPVYYQIEADYDLICQAVENVLANAVTYTPPEGKININASVDEVRGIGVIQISDTGIGIEPEELPRIFQKFYRVHANEKLASGTGLGLPLAKYIVEEIHGGKLSVTSEPGAGSSFRMELPLVK